MTTCYKLREDYDSGSLEPKAFITHICRPGLLKILINHMKVAKKAKKFVGLDGTVVKLCADCCSSQFEDLEEKFIKPGYADALEVFIEPTKLKSVMFLFMSSLRLHKHDRACGDPASMSRDVAVNLAKMDPCSLFPANNHNRLLMLSAGFDHIGRYNKVTDSAVAAAKDFDVPNGKGLLLAYNPLRNAEFYLLRKEWHCGIKDKGESEKRATSAGVVVVAVTSLVTNILKTVHDNRHLHIWQLEEKADEIKRIAKAGLKKDKLPLATQIIMNQKATEKALFPSEPVYTHRAIRARLIRDNILLLSILHMASQNMRAAEFTGIANYDLMQDMGVGLGESPLILRAFFPVHALPVADRLIINKFLTKNQKAFITLYPDNKPACAAACDLASVAHFALRFLVRLAPQKLFSLECNPHNMMLFNVNQSGAVNLHPVAGQLLTGTLDKWLKAATPDSMVQACWLSTYSFRTSHAVSYQFHAILDSEVERIVKMITGHTPGSKQIIAYSKTSGRIFGLTEDDPKILMLLNFWFSDDFQFCLSPHLWDVCKKQKC